MRSWKALIVIGGAVAALGAVALLASNPSDDSSRHATTAGQPPAVTSTGPAAGSRAPLSSVARLLATDVEVPSEERPHGVPDTYSWAAGPRPGRAFSQAHRFGAVTGWGQVYRCAGAPRVSGAEIELGAIDLWLYRRSQGRWTRVQGDVAVHGGDFPETYRGDRRPWSARKTGPTSVAVTLRPGYNVHVWPPGRFKVSPSDIRAAVVVMRARLLPTSSGATPCVALSVGGDLWKSISTQPGNPADVADFGIGRFKRVEPRWRTYSMTAGDRSLVTDAPPPLRIAATQLR